MGGSLGSSGGRAGRGDGFNGNGHLAMGRVTRRGTNGEEKMGVDYNRLEEYVDR